MQVKRSDMALLILLLLAKEEYEIGLIDYDTYEEVLNDVTKGLRIINNEIIESGGRPWKST